MKRQAFVVVTEANTFTILITCLSSKDDSLFLDPTSLTMRNVSDGKSVILKRKEMITTLHITPIYRVVKDFFFNNFLFIYEKTTTFCQMGVIPS